MVHVQPSILASSLFGTPVSIDGMSEPLHDLGAVRVGSGWLITAVRTRRGVGTLVGLGESGPVGLSARGCSQHEDVTWLREALFDRQIVDLDGRRVIRVADVVLRREGDALTVAAVDVGASAVLRRLGLAWLASRFQPQLLAIDRLHVPSGVADALLLDESRARLEELETAQATDLLARLPVPAAEHAVRNSRHRGAVHEHHRRRRRRRRHYRRLAP